METRTIGINDVVRDAIDERLWVCISVDPVTFQPLEMLYPEAMEEPLSSKLVPTETWPTIR